MENKKIYVFLISMMLLALSTPLVIAATEDHLIITFDPDGDIDIDVNISAYNFSTIVVNQYKNTTGGFFTLYNNGTVAMDTQIKSNATTDEADLSLNASGVAPGLDEYAIKIEGLDVENFVTTAYSLEFDTNLAPSSSKTFDIGLQLGSSLSANHSWQTTTISFQGSQS
jgi:hypothetical protein